MEGDSPESELPAKPTAATRRWLASLRKPPELRRFAGHAAYVSQMKRPLRVAHLTDLHVGRVTPMDVQMMAVELTNRQKPDLVAITGDFVCHGQGYLNDVYRIVSAIEAPVVAVMGNHDHWCGCDDVREVLRRAGAQVLDNASTVMTFDDQPLQIVGIDDAYTGHADIECATRNLDPFLPTLGLSHIPEEAGLLWAKGAPLVLSGHTHAGQISLGGLHNLWMGKFIGHRYVHGLYGSRSSPPPDGAVYVSAGIGAAVVPLRMGARARREVAIFELGVAPGSFSESHAEQVGHPGRAVSDRKKASRAAKVVRNAEKRTRKANRNPPPENQGAE